MTTHSIRPAAFSVPLLAIFTMFGFGAFAGSAAAQQKQAVSATVTGNDQHVGFRAMVMKQAIKYNLAGSAKNDGDNVVQFTTIPVGRARAATNHRQIRNFNKLKCFTRTTVV